MDQLDREAEPFFSQPVRTVISMLVVLGLVAFGGYLIFPSVAPVFLTSPYLNGFILLVLVAGILACFWQVIQLVASVSWIVGFAANRAGHQFTTAPRLLAPLAALLRARGARNAISPSSARSILDSVATRLDEARDITRYIGSLLIFLGLLGTFYGLATTVPALVDTIQSLAPQEGETGVQVFSKLMVGLEAQLSGMGTAFASSLLGLAGSLVVGLLELFAGHGQNRFYGELEEWLSNITRLSLAGDGAAGDTGQMAGVVDHMVEQMDMLQTMLARTDGARVETEAQLRAMTEAVERMANGSAGGAGTLSVLERIADGQDKLLAIMASDEGGGAAGVDAESRMRLRSIDVQLLRILEEISAGRQETMSELRTDLAELVRELRSDSTPTGRPRT